MAVVRWTFYDPVDDVTYELDLNPHTGGDPQYRKSLTHESTAAPGGLQLLFEGADEPQQLSWDGAIVEAGHHAALRTWWDKRRQILLTNDLGEQFWIYIKSYEPKRKRSALNPYRRDYSMTAVILNWSWS